MTDEKKHLEDMFERVGADTPELGRAELRSLLEKRSSQMPAGSMQTSNRISKKGVYLMSSIIVVAAALVYLLSANTPQVKDHIAGKTSVTNSQNTSAVSPAVGQEGIASVTQEKRQVSENGVFTDTLDKKFKPFGPIDLSNISPIPVSDEDLWKLCLYKSDSGDIFMNHKGMEASFPLDTAVKHNFYDAGMLYIDDIHPTYATDARGNLLMIYERTEKGNSQRIMMIELPDDGSVEKTESNYHKTQSISRSNGRFDSTVTPPQYYSTFKLRVGIMSLDTVTHCDADKRNDGYFDSKVEKSVENLMRKDSLLKLSYGNAPVIAQRFQMDLSSAAAKKDPLAIKINHVLDSIDRTDVEPDRKWSLKDSYIDELLRGHYPDTVKLALEQLLMRLNYEGSLANHKEIEDNLANITSLVPLQIRKMTRLKSDGKYDDGLICWFEPTKELFIALPQLKASIASTPKNITSNITSIRIYPNPASEYLNVNYSISHPAALTLELFDLSGRSILKDMAIQYDEAGNYKRTLPLVGIAQGIYVLVLTDDKGGESVQRVVVEK